MMSGRRKNQERVFQTVRSVHTHLEIVYLACGQWHYLIRDHPPLEITI